MAASVLARFDHQLGIIEFIQATKVNIEQLYIDRFWESIAEDKWIYVGSDLLLWLGYISIDPYKSKERYTGLLQAHFTQQTDFRYLTASEMKHFCAVDGHDGFMALPGDINPHNKVKHLLVSPDCFKESLMMLETARAKEIRKYYLILEKVFKSYMSYCNAFKDRQIIAIDVQLQKANLRSATFKELVVKKHQYTLSQYVYIATSRNYARQNIFKVGTTTNPKTRISGYQTGRCEDDRFGYVYMMPCYNGRAMEAFIFSYLENYRYGDDKRELFHIHFDALMRVMKVFETFAKESAKVFNDTVDAYYDSYHEREPVAMDDLFIRDMGEHLEEMFGVVPVENYIPPIDLEPSAVALTNEMINDTLRPCGMQLVGEYSGRCEEQQTFKCRSVLNHEFSVTWDHLNENKERGCPYCRKHCILDKVPIYVYEDRSYKHITTYGSFDELRRAEPDINHQLLKNIIREERWLTPHHDRIYSILSPQAGALSLTKSQTAVEKAIIDILGIDFDLMRTNTLRTKMSYIIAIDEASGIAYFDTSATQFAKLLNGVGTTRKVNRKTIPKYLNSSKRYAGYKWITSTCNSCSPYEMVDLQTLGYR